MQSGWHYWGLCELNKSLGGRIKVEEHRSQIKIMKQKLHILNFRTFNLCVREKLENNSSKITRVVPGLYECHLFSDIHVTIVGKLIKKLILIFSN